LLRSSCRKLKVFLILFIFILHFVLKLHTLPFDPASFTEGSSLLDTLNSLPLDPAGLAKSAGFDGFSQVRLMHVSVRNLSLTVVTHCYFVSLVSKDKIPIIAAAGAMSLSFFIAGFLGTTSKKGGSTVAKAAKPIPKPPPVDLSVPYDAASLLAFKKWKDPFFLSQQGGEREFDDALYQKFKGIYKTKTVAAMKLKKVQRDAAEILSKAENDLAALMEK
jgi:hypothetical protein